MKQKHQLSSVYPYDRTNNEKYDGEMVQMLE